MNVTGQTKILGIIGSPIKHSLSPVMHNYASQLLGMDYIYTAFPIDPTKPKEIVEGIRALGIRGVNVTMPCKKSIIPYLDKISTQAETMNAVNTIVNDNGILTGYNTDGIGMVNSIKSGGVSIKDKIITLFGTGGAATAILVAMSGDVKTINLFNRKGTADSDLQLVIDKIKNIAPNLIINLHSLENKAAIASCVSSSDILINATPLGMADLAYLSPIEDTSLYRPEHVVVESVYNPVNTKFLLDATKAGCKTIDGRGMLLWQGVEAYRLFTGKEMPVEEVKKVVFGE